MAGIRLRPRTVVAPDGRDWTVGRVWLPRPPRWRRTAGRGSEPDDRDHRGEETLEALGNSGFDAGVDALGEGPVAVIAALIVGALLAAAVILVFPVLVFIGDLFLVLLIAAGGIAVKVLFRRPWKIEARTLGPLFEEHTFAVVGVRASAEAVDTVAAAIQRGTPVGEILLGPR